MEKVDCTQRKSETDGSQIPELLTLIKRSRNYMKDNLGLIKSVYLIPLTEHCTKRKMSSRGKDGESENKKAAEKLERDKTEKPEEFLRNAIEKWSFWNDEDQSSSNMRSGHRTTFAEFAAMNRLSTLLDLLKKMIHMMDRLIKGINAAPSILNLSKEQTKGVVAYAVILLEVSCSLAEVFRLPSVSLDVCESSIQKYLSNVTTYKAKECASFSTDSSNHIARLEAQINYLRAIVYMFGSYMICIIQTCVLSVRPELLEVDVREVMGILTKLPPMYLRSKKLSYLTTVTSEILDKAPPNKRMYPLPPKPAKERQDLATGSNYEKRKISKAFQRKYVKARTVSEAKK